MSSRTMTNRRRLLAISTVTAILQAVIGLLSGQDAFVWTALLTAGVGVVIDVVGTLLAEQKVRWPWSPVPNGDIKPHDLVVVPRSALQDKIVEHVLATEATKVALTTGLLGAGGFGKTTLAYMVADDPRVKKQFPGGRHFVTIGDDLSEARLAGKINDITEKLTRERPNYVDPELAGQHLREQLGKGKRKLLIIDDVWRSDQLNPFLKGGSGRCVFLVTTRKPDLLGPTTPQVAVDQVSKEEAAAIIRNGLNVQIPKEQVAALVAATGCWPLLLSLVNARLLRVVRDNGDATAAAEEILRSFRDNGPKALDLLKTSDRSKAVWITVGLSTSQLSGIERERFEELGVFAADDPIPVSLVIRLWRETGGMSEQAARGLIQSLVELSLARRSSDTLILHDVILEYLRYELTPEGALRVNTALLTSEGRSLRGPAGAVEWWLLDINDEYLWRHLPSLLATGGLADERNALVTNLRWVSTKLALLGLREVMADLEEVSTDRASALRLVLSQNYELLKPTDPVDSIKHVLFNRLRDIPEWRVEVHREEAAADWPRLVNRWPLPDAFAQSMVGLLARATSRSPHLLAFSEGNPQQTLLAAVGSRVQTWDVASRTLLTTITTGDPQNAKDGRVAALAVAPSGTFFATARDNLVQIWEPGQPEPLRTLDQHRDQVHAIDISADSGLLASTGADRTVHVWDMHTGEIVHNLDQIQSPVRALAISPDGAQIAMASEDDSIWVWNLVDQSCSVVRNDVTNVQSLSFADSPNTLVTVRHHRRRILMETWEIANGACQSEFKASAEAWLPAIVLPGNRLAAAYAELTTRIWNSSTKESLATYRGHNGAIAAIATTADGNLLATAARDGDIRLWDMTSTERPEEVGDAEIPNGGRAVVAAADGSWFAASGDDQPVHIWDVRTRRCQAELSGHTGTVFALGVSPNGECLITGGDDRAIRLWNLDGSLISSPGNHTNTIRAIATAPNGEWFAAADLNGAVQVWDYQSPRARMTLESAGLVAHALAITPTSDLLIVAGGHQNIELWDTLTWTRQSPLVKHTDWIRALSVSPDGTRLASAGRDRTVCLWNLQTRQCEAVLRGHNDWVHTVAFSPGNRYLATAGRDREIRIWDTKKQSHPCVATMRVTGSVRSCAWLKDHELIAAGAGGIYVFGLLIPK